MSSQVDVATRAVMAALGGRLWVGPDGRCREFSESGRLLHSFQRRFTDPLFASGRFVRVGEWPEFPVGVRARQLLAARSARGYMRRQVRYVPFE